MLLLPAGQLAAELLQLLPLLLHRLHQPLPLLVKLVASKLGLPKERCPLAASAGHALSRGFSSLMNGEPLMAGERLESTVVHTLRSH